MKTTNPSLPPAFKIVCNQVVRPAWVALSSGTQSLPLETANAWDTYETESLPARVQLATEFAEWLTTRHCQKAWQQYRTENPSGLNYQAWLGKQLNLSATYTWVYG